MENYPPEILLQEAYLSDHKKKAKDRDSVWLKERFPSIQRHLRQKGLDITRDMLPVIPAAHYTCGGVATDLNGCTSIPGLFAAGESARTGLHGGKG